MKKLLAIGGVIVAIFALILVLNNQSNKEKLKNNPYPTENLHQATKDLIGNKNYDHIILPDALNEKIESGEPVFAYFFSPTCPHCMEFTPRMMPIADDMDIDVFQFNVLEFPNEAKSALYDIEVTPTTVYFENGEEVGRMVGGQSDENVRAFFDQAQNE